MNVTQVRIRYETVEMHPNGVSFLIAKKKKNTHLFFLFFIYNSLLKQIDINTANWLLTYIIIMLQLILLILII